MTMTKVKVEFFKYSGKWYTSFDFLSDFRPYQFDSIKKEVMQDKRFLSGMNYTIEVELDGGGWNKYLFLVSGQEHD